MAVAEAGFLLLSFVLYVLLSSSFKMYKKQSQLPPGPRPWLFLGNLLQKEVLPLHIHYRKLIEKYGHVFTVWMGSNPVVVLCGYEVNKEALVEQAEEFGGRAFIPLNMGRVKGEGMATTNDTKWREIRRFTLSTLRNFGMGKRTMSERVQLEARYLVEEMAATQGQAFDPTKIITSTVSNVICSVVFGNRFDYRDQAFLEQQHIVAERLRFIRSTSGRIYRLNPKLMDYMPGWHKKTAALGEKMYAFIHEKVESHRQTLDPQNPRDYIDCFLARFENDQKSTEDILSHEDLVMTVIELFFAGTSTTSQAVLRSLLAMAKFPNIQAKVQQEIDQVVGANRTPGMEDRMKMPFTNAVIHEIQRYEETSLEVLPRATTSHTKFKGYIIPQGTSVIPLLSSVHFDPLQWETPEKFNPGHFLNEKGEFRKRDAFMPFSAGKRACPGEALARMELFLFFSTLLQNFTFQLAGDTKETDLMSLIANYRQCGVYPPVQAIRRPMCSI
ncbi:cytochrome P450 2B4-like [Hemicordylus capensis]|uniref:cytochrome P450 2B4-like n=1 Tax=Hemicordylus capensis TaxID=884348 RepID=UPI0023040D6D|nr:cytochrome P450 2B4-like [Hemicordylus capensis]